MPDFGVVVFGAAFVLCLSNHIGIESDVSGEAISSIVDFYVATFASPIDHCCIDSDVSDGLFSIDFGRNQS